MLQYDDKKANMKIGPHNVSIMKQKWIEPPDLFC